MKNSINKKLRIAVIATIAVVILLAVGVFALFSDYDEGKTDGKIGTVGVELVANSEGDKVTLSNDENINPGDYDPNNPGGSKNPVPTNPDGSPSDPNKPPARPGTPHDLEFTVRAKGNKSEVTRNRIIIVVSDSPNPNDKNANLYDPSPFKLLEFDTDNELVVRSDIKEDGKLKAIQYIVKGHVFNGVGTGAEIEDPAEVLKQGYTIGDAKGQSYKYKLMMDRNADNTYQGLYVHIQVIVEAMQYRNSTDNDWEVIGNTTVTLGSGQQLKDVVPQSNQDKNGNTVTKPSK